MSEPLEQYVHQFTTLNCNRTQGHISPHKPVMLLALLDTYEGGESNENRFSYEQLLEPFNRYFDVVRQEGDNCTPILPFFYLKSEDFWHHQPAPGKDAVYEALSGPQGVGKFLEIARFAYIDEALHKLLQTPENRDTLRSAIIGRYFSGCREDLWKLINQIKIQGQYEQFLRHQVQGVAEEEPDVDEKVRDAAFSRIVRKAYDFRCSACGLRVILQNGHSIVDAAHLVPFNVSGDNNPDNGMALCKNHHWAMDRNLIAPCPDGKWHVSGELDHRIEGQKELCGLEGQDIILPRNKEYHPSEHGLSWRHDNLL